MVLHGNLFDSAIMKTERDLGGIPQALSVPIRKTRTRSKARAIVFEGPEDYHHRIDDPTLKIDENTMLFIRGAGPIGYPGAAEVVNMQPPAALHQTRHHLAALHRRRAAIGHVGLALDPQCLAGSGGRRRARDSEDRRPRAHRPQQGRGEYPDLRGGTRPSAARALQRRGGFKYPGEPDAVAGNPARHGRSARRRHGAEARGEISARRAERSGVPRDNH